MKEVKWNLDGEINNVFGRGNGNNRNCKKRRSGSEFEVGKQEVRRHMLKERRSAGSHYQEEGKIQGTARDRGMEDWLSV